MKNYNKIMEQLEAENKRLKKIEALFIEVDKRVIWESLGLGNTLAEEIEKAILPELHVPNDEVTK